MSIFTRIPSSLPENNSAGEGPIAALEQRLCRFYGVPHCLLVDNATNGLLALALALPLDGVEIITTPRSYGATWAPFKLLGNKLIFAKTCRNGNIC